MSRIGKVEWEKKLEIVNDGCVQRSCRSISYPDDKHGSTLIELTTALPSLILPQTWATNNWSEQDVKIATQHVPEQMLWLSCLLHGIDVIPSSLKPCSVRVHDIGFSYRKEALQALFQIQHKNKDDKTTRTQKMVVSPCDEYEQHNNSLLTLLSGPIIALPELIINDMLANLTGNLQGCNITQVAKKYRIDESWYIPTVVANNRISARKIVAYDDWRASRNSVNVFGISNLPTVVRCQQDLFVVCDEVIQIVASEETQ